MFSENVVLSLGVAQPQGGQPSRRGRKAEEQEGFHKCHFLPHRRVGRSARLVLGGTGTCYLYAGAFAEAQEALPPASVPIPPCFPAHLCVQKPVSCSYSF